MKWSKKIETPHNSRFVDAVGLIDKPVADVEYVGGAVPLFPQIPWT